MHTTVERLTALLAEEIDSLGQFCSLLRQEREALAAQGHARLQSLVARKEQLHRRLAELAEWRQKEIQASDNMRDQLHRLAPSLAQRWDELIELARQAHELNGINGRIIELQLQNTEQGLQLLKASEEISSLYTPAGQPAAPQQGRHLGSA